MPDPDPKFSTREYYKLVRKMAEAGRKWIDAQPEGELHLSFRAFAQPTTGNLDERGINIYGLNELSRQMLRAMDKAVKHEGTLLMAQEAVADICADHNVVNLDIYPTKN